jgi:superfamily II DNA or RNA helicase
MKYVKRDYAEACIASVFGELSRIRSTLCVLATGVGKTRIFLQIAERWLAENPGRRVLVVAHREELIYQPARHWHSDTGVWPAIEMGDTRADAGEQGDLFDPAPRDDRLVIASVPTLNFGRRCPDCTAGCGACGGEGRTEGACDCAGAGCVACKGAGVRRVKCGSCDGDRWVGTRGDCAVCFEHFLRRMQKFRPQDFGLLVIDEAHRSVATTYTRIVRYFRGGNPGLKLLGVTATPDRADEQALGQVYESVAYEYSLPGPIEDGWLTPIEQQVITVDGLRLANVRTTAGDFNVADLEAEMLAEEVVHKVTTPLIEIACGLEPGTLGRLVATNRVHELPALAPRREPTLVHGVDVAHAERITEILNRYLPGAALCITGTTPTEVRREGLARFEAGGHQFLVSCGVFLEGTDLPNVSVVAMARPTKFRALYAQMLGRGLRVLPGTTDGAADAEERRRRIAASAKPRCLVLDFVDNSGRHRLVCAADLLGDALPKELVEGVKRKVAQAGAPVDVLAELAAARREAGEWRRREARQQAQERREEEDAARRAAEARRGIMADATYAARRVNPFDTLGLVAEREPGDYRGRKPTEAMKETLRKNKLPFTEETTFWEARQLIDEVTRRYREGLCTPAQAEWLVRHGYSPSTTFAECRRIMDGWEANDWAHPAPREVRPDMRPEELLDLARERGLRVVLRDGGRPVIVGGGGDVEPALLAALRHQRERVVEVLKEAAAAAERTGSE